MLTQLKSDATPNIHELSLHRHESPQPRPFLLHPYREAGLFHLIFYVSAAFYAIIVTMAEVPGWRTAVFLFAGTIFYASLVIRSWEDNQRTFCLSRSVGSWLLQSVLYLLLPAATLLFLALAGMLFLDWHKSSFPITFSWWEPARMAIKQVAGLICVVGFLGINAVKASPGITERTWEGLSLAEMLLIWFLMNLCISELVITVV